MKTFVSLLITLSLIAIASAGAAGKEQNDDDDSPVSFTGTWQTIAGDTDQYTVTLKQIPDAVDETWNGKRAPSPADKASESEEKAAEKVTPATFAGVWHAKLGETALELILQQNGDQVTGQLKGNSADLGVMSGDIVVANTLRFKIVRAGNALRNGLRLPDEFLGNGELVMDGGGKSFKGTILGTATSGSFAGR